MKSTPSPAALAAAFAPAGPLGSRESADQAQTARRRSVMLAAAVIVTGFLLVVLGLRLTDPRYVTAYFLALAGLVVGAAYAPMLVRPLAASLASERLLVRAGVIVCASLLPFVASDAYQLHVMALGGVFALMAIGLNVTTGLAGLAEFGYIAYYAIGAYVSALLNTRFGIDFWLCLPLAGLVTATISMAVALPAVRITGHYLALVTLGFSFIVIQLITNVASVTGGTQGVSGIEPPSILGHSFYSPIAIGSVKLAFQANYYYLVLLLLIGAVFVCSKLSASRWGRAWGAMRNDEVAAQSSGLDLMSLKLLAFGTGAAMGGIAGSVYAHMVGFIDPTTFRFMESIFLLAIVAIGNWRISGVIAAAVLFTVLPEKLRAFDEWRLLIFGALMLIIMLTRGRRMLSSSH